ncbi:hypothetical protein WJ63_27225 [Burkholderia pyrrocinia]|uniref:hypothetical protein n=1 Tax=Burkholderia stagnalis TaxID=1503054 RepID=UPI0002F7566A|nr:hypothetical protein [Burkholderia stagnalis]KVN42072.1 hypothetical protein WJ63_27225 [Burkholderia pyrrocinia]WGS45345.1 hypothetical protein LFL97_21615 [Burkholderia sp. JSH-S8]
MDVINSNYEIGFLLVVFVLLGVVLVGALLTAMHLERWHPRLIGAAIGALIGIALIEAVPMLT